MSPPEHLLGSSSSSGQILIPEFYIDLNGGQILSVAFSLQNSQGDTFFTPPLTEIRSEQINKASIDLSSLPLTPTLLLKTTFSLQSSTIELCQFFSPYSPSTPLKPPFRPLIRSPMWWTLFGSTTAMMCYGVLFIFCLSKKKPHEPLKEYTEFIEFNPAANLRHE